MPSAAHRTRGTNGILLWFCFTLLLFRVVRAGIIDGPRTAVVNVGEWANFTCKVECTHTVNWNAEGYTGGITQTCSQMVGGMMACREVLESCSDPSSTGNKERLRIMPGAQHAGSSIAVQCSATATNFRSDNCPPNLSFSRFVLLRVNPLPTTPPPATTPTTNPPATDPDTTLPEASSELSELPSPSPTSCPPPLTVTKVVTETSTVTVYPSMIPSPPAIGGSYDSRNRFSAMLYDLLSWILTLLVGLVAVL